MLPKEKTVNIFLLISDLKPKISEVICWLRQTPRIIHTYHLRLVQHLLPSQITFILLLRVKNSFNQEHALPPVFCKEIKYNLGSHNFLDVTNIMIDNSCRCSNYTIEGCGNQSHCKCQSLSPYKSLYTISQSSA